MPQSLTDESISACQRLIMTVYDKKMKFGDCDLGDLRFFLFNSSSSNDLRRLPPTADSLKQHVLRAAYQAGWIWGSCIFKNSTLPDPKNWGWRPDGSMLVPVWKTQETANYNILFTVCSCQKKCQRCKCSKLELSCLPFCKCLQKCSETYAVIFILLETCAFGWLEGAGVVTPPTDLYICSLSPARMKEEGHP